MHKRTFCLSSFLLLTACGVDDSPEASHGSFVERCVAHMQSLNRRIYASEDVSITEAQCSCMQDIASRLVSEGKMPSDDYGIFAKSKKYMNISMANCALKANGREVPAAFDVD